jgi:biotin-(acetyl-CoA carboxylase) ligase
LLAACMLTSSVLSTNAWRSSSNGPETAVGRGRRNRSWASSANTRSESELVCPPLVRRRKPNRVRAAYSVAAWVR